VPRREKENEDEGDSLMANNQLDAPPELIYGPFPAVKQFPSIAPDSFELMPAFLHEANYYHNKVVYQPWNKANFSECVKLVFDKWRQLKQEIQLFVKERDSNRLQQGLTIGVEYFLECLYWVNEKPVTFKNGLVDPSLEVKPFNLEDRLQFILKRLNGYHSFKQLDELYKELEKQFAIKLVRLKRSN
jgi:hypothetical protein